MHLLADAAGELGTERLDYGYERETLKLERDRIVNATVWNNGHHHESGAGYGIKISASDRDRHFKRSWGSISLRIEDQPDGFEVNVDKDSFWSEGCRELIHIRIGSWLRKKKIAPWPKREPPKLELIPLGGRFFRLQRRL
jgi:hypothetical protein